MLLCQQYVPNLVLYCLKRNSQTFRGAEMFFFIVQQLLCCKKKKPTRTVKHTSPNRGCFYQQWVLCTLAERVLLSDEAEESITFHPCYRAGRRLSVIPTHDLIAAMIGKGSLWKHCAQSLPGVIPVGLCQELSWPKGWIIWCVTQLVIYFLNNSEFRVKQILWPRTLPHSPPIFLWVTCGAAGKPIVFLNLHSRAGAFLCMAQREKGFSSLIRNLTSFFSRGLKTASVCSLSSFVVCYRHTLTDLSIHTATACPASWFVCCWFQILPLPCDGWGVSMLPTSVYIYICF